MARVKTPYYTIYARIENSSSSAIDKEYTEFIDKEVPRQNLMTALESVLIGGDGFVKDVVSISVIRTYKWVEETSGI